MDVHVYPLVYHYAYYTMQGDLQRLKISIVLEDHQHTRVVWASAGRSQRFEVLVRAFPVCTPVRFVVYPWIATVIHLFQGYIDIFEGVSTGMHRVPIGGIFQCTEHRQNLWLSVFRRNRAVCASVGCLGNPFVPTLRSGYVQTAAYLVEGDGTSCQFDAARGARDWLRADLSPPCACA